MLREKEWKPSIWNHSDNLWRFHRKRGLNSRRVSDEVFDRFFLGILNLVEDDVTVAKLVGLRNTTKLTKLIIFKVRNEDDFDFPFETSNSNQPVVKSTQNL